MPHPGRVIQAHVPPPLGGPAVIILTPVAVARSSCGQARRAGKLPLRPVAGACHRSAQSQLVTVSKRSGYVGWPV